MPTVSVIIPTYNRGDVLKRAINSVIEQSYGDYELIVIDDCSTDNTKKVVQSFEDQILYVRHNTNKGAPSARNTGIKIASGDYVAFLDSDDEWYPNKLEEQINLFKKLPSNFGLVYSGFIKHYGEYSEVGNIPQKKGNIYKEQLYRDHINPTSTVMVRSECFDEVGHFRTDLPARQDYEMWLRISKEYNVDYVSDILSVLYIDQENRITDNTKNRIEAHNIILESIESEIENYPLHVRNSIKSTQYYTLARHLQKHKKYEQSKLFAVKSIRAYPLNLRALIIFLFSYIKFETESEKLIKIKNISKYISQKIKN